MRTEYSNLLVGNIELDFHCARRRHECFSNAKVELLNLSNSVFSK